MTLLYSPWLYSTLGYGSASIIWCCVPYPGVSSYGVGPGKHAGHGYRSRRWIRKAVCRGKGFGSLSAWGLVSAPSLAVAGELGTRTIPLRRPTNPRHRSRKTWGRVWLDPSYTLSMHAPT